MSGEARWAVAWLLPAIFAAMVVPAIPAAAAQMSCTAYSLSRNEIAHALAVARPALPRAVHVEVNFACWNSDHALVDLETPRMPTIEGVQQWWAVSCQRNDSAWTCDRPEFKQYIEVKLTLGNQTHTVELSFGQEIPLSRARALASQSLAFYLDPDSRLRDCGTIEDSASRQTGVHRNDERPSPTEPFHVNVIRDGSTDSVWLNDVDVIMSFDPHDEQTPCRQDIVTVD